MRSRLLAASLVLGSLLLSPLTQVHARDPVVIRFSHVVADSTPKGQGARLLQKLVEQRLSGEVVVEVYPNSTLYGDKDELAALQRNDVQMLAPSMAKFSKLSPGVLVFDLPFLFDNQAAVERFQRRPQGRELLLSMERDNVVGLAFWHNGMKQLSATRALHRPEDARDLTFRIQPSPVLDAQFAAVQAKSLQLPFSQLRSALVENRVQGAENPWSNIHSQKIDQIQPYIIESNHGFLDYMLVTNPRFWYELPYSIRSDLESIIAEVTHEVNKMASELNERDRQAILADGKTRVISLTPEERQAWRVAMQPVWQQFSQQIGEERVQAAIRANR